MYRLIKHVCILIVAHELTDHHSGIGPPPSPPPPPPPPPPPQVTANPLLERTVEQICWVPVKLQVTQGGH
jgi:hypothetical protein